MGQEERAALLAATEGRDTDTHAGRAMSDTHTHTREGTKRDAPIVCIHRRYTRVHE